MDKKLLVSLMMTAPVAAFAASNWVADGNGSLDYQILAKVNPENWTSDGAANFTTLANGSLNCPVSAGFLKHSQALAVGDYNLTAGTFYNAIVKINGEWKAKKVNDKYVDSEGKVLKDQSDYTSMVPELPSSITLKSSALSVEVYPQDKGKDFQVGKLTFTLNFNFETVKTDLQTRLDNINNSIVVVNPDDNRTEAATLRTEYNGLTVGDFSTRANIQNTINAIDLNDGSKLYTAYNTYSLNKWNAVQSKASDTISTSLNNFQTAVNTYNDKANAENLAWANYVKNTQDLNALNGEVIQLQKELNDKKTDIDNILLNQQETGQLAEYLKFITAKDIDDAQAAINTYQAKINQAYADLYKTVTFTSEASTISAKIAAIDYTEDIADWNAYKTFIETDLPSVSAEYGRIFALINDVKVPLNGGWYSVAANIAANVYEDVIGQANKDIAAIYKNNAEYAINQAGGLTPTNVNISGAAAKLAGVESVMAQRKADMLKVYTDELDADNSASLLSLQQAAWASAKATVSAYQTGLQAKKDVAASDAFKQLKPADQNKLNADITKIETALNALKKYDQDQYIAHKLNLSSADYAAKIQAVDDANTAYDNDAASLGGVIALIANFNAAKKYVETKTSASNIASYNLSDKFAATFTNIDTAIKTLYNDKTGSATDIQDAIDASKTMCDALVNAFVNVINKVNAAQSALNKFNTAISGKQVVTFDGESAYNKGAYTYPCTVDGETQYLSAQDFQTRLTAYLTQLQEIASAKTNPQVACDEANKESGQITTDNYASLIALAQTDFLTTVTNANLQFVQDLSDDITEKKTEAPYATAVGMGSIDINKLTFDEKYTGAKTVADAAANVTAAGTNVSKLATCDSDLQTIANAYTSIYAAIEKVVENYDAYAELYNGDPLIGFTNGLSNQVQTNINVFAQSIIDNTDEPAVTFYNKQNAGFQTRLDNIRATILRNYNAMTAKANFTANKKSLTDLQAEISQMDTDMKANQTYYNDQWNAADAIATDANNLINYLNNHDNVVSNRDKYIDLVNGVLNQLADLNVELTKSFGQGESVKEDPTYQARFDKLKDELNKIYTDENADYLNAVQASNDAWFKANFLGSNVLTDQYNAAIAEVNDYRYTLTNADYYNALMADQTFKDNHEKLQQCYSRINELNKLFNSYRSGLYVSNQRDDWKVLNGTLTFNYNSNTDESTLTGNTSNAPATLNKVSFVNIATEANELHNLIATSLANINAAAEAVADTFYADNEGLAEQVWGQRQRGSIYNRLITAGLTQNTTDPDTGDVIEGEITKQIGSQLTDLATAIKTYNGLQANIASGKANAVHDYIMEMDKIANLLAKILPAYADRNNQAKIQEYEDNIVKNAVNKTWTANYNAAVTTLNGYLSDMAGYTADPDKASHIATVSSALATANTLNTQWNRLDNDAATRESNFDQFENIDLANALASAETAYEASKKANEIKSFNNDAYNQLTDRENPASSLSVTLDELNDLLEWSGYHASQLATIAGLNNAINTAETNVNTAITTAAAASKVNVDNLKTQFTSIQTRIAAAYETVYDEEVAYANGLLMLANSAFNDAKLKMEEQKTRDAAPDLDELDKEIKKYNDALLALASAYDEDEKDDLKAQVIDIEDALCQIIDTLEQYSKPGGEFGEPTLVDTLAALDKTYNDLNTEFTNLLNDINTKGENANTQYGQYGTTVINAYAPDVQKAITELGTYNSEYNGLGVDVIADADKYSYLMDQLGKAVDALEPQWTAAQAEADKKAASDRRYDSLIEVLDQYKADVQYAYTQAEEYKSNVRLTDYNKLQVYFQGSVNPTTGQIIAISEYTRLDNLRRQWKVTNSVDLPSNLEEDVDAYVRLTLVETAQTYVTTTEKLGDNVIAEIENPGTNEKKWVQAVLNAEESIKDVEKELRDLMDVSLTPIYGQENNAYDPSLPNIVIKMDPNNAEEAKTEYAKVNAEIKTIEDNIKAIYNKAMTEDLIVKGDVEADGDINILDVMKLINLVGENVNLEGADKAIADVNDDDLVNISDVTELINYMMNPKYGNNGQYRIPAFIGASSGNNSYLVAEVEGENGLRRFAVNLANEVNFVAGQLDIKLPGHARVAGVHVGDRANALDTYVFENDGYTRVLMTALDNSPIEGNNGCVLFIDVEGNAEVEVENMVFSDINGNSYFVSENSESGVGIMDAVKDGVKAIYNAAGQKFNKLTKGVNIVRNADGSVTKKIGK